MDTPPSTVVARVPRIVRCLDAHGRPVTLSAATLGRSSTALQDLLRRIYSAARGPGAHELVTVSFQEEAPGELKLEYLVVDSSRRSSWRRRLSRRQEAQAEAARAALAAATTVVAAAVEAIGPLAAARAAQWSTAETPSFVDVVLDGTRTVRMPRALQDALGDEAVLDLMRRTLRMFVDDDVERMIVGKDPETPGWYHETVICRSAGLVDFIRGGPLTSLRPAAPEREQA